MGVAGVRRPATPTSSIEGFVPDRGQIGMTRARVLSWWVAGAGSLAGELAEAGQGPPCPTSAGSGRLAWWSSGVGGPKAGQGHSCPMGVRSGRLGGLAWWSSVDGGAKLDGGYYGRRLTEWWWFGSIFPVFVTDLAVVVCFSSVKFPLRVFTLMFGRLIPRMVFATPIRLELSFGPHFLPDAGNRGKIPSYLMITVLLHSIQLYFACLVFVIPRMGFITPTWPELGFGSLFLREIMPLGNWLFPIWYSDSLQEIIFCKRIITVGGGFVPQSLAGDPVLVVYILGVFCIFNGFVCLFHGTPLFRDLYVLLIEPFSAVMDFVQFNH